MNPSSAACSWYTARCSRFTPRAAVSVTVAHRRRGVFYASTAKMTTMAPPPPAGSTPEPLREIKRQRRERLAKPDENLGNDTVESYLVKQRDLILAEMDGLTGRLVADHHDAVSKAMRRCGRSAPRRSRSPARAR